MEYNFFAPIRGLQFEENFNEYILNNVYFTNSLKNILGQMVDLKKFSDSIGFILQEFIEDTNVYMYLKVKDNKDFLVFNDGAMKHINKIFDDINDYFEEFLFRFWIMTDCSVSISTVFLQYSNSKLETHTAIGQINAKCYDSIGNNYNSNLTVNRPFFIDFEKSIKDFGSNIYAGIKRQQFDKNQSIESVVGFNKYAYNTISIVYRALYFIKLSRKEHHIPLKILFYITAFETLFSTEPFEVTHQVSENVANYIGRNKEEKIEVYNLMKKIYRIRSRFVHGDDLPTGGKTYIDLSTLSKKTDNLLRSIVNNIILIDFKHFETPDKKKAFLQNLLFNGH